MIDDAARIEAAISFIPAIDRDVWVEVGMAVKSELGDSGFDLWDRWSSYEDSYNEASAKAVWKSISPTGAITIGTLFHYAKLEGWTDDGKRPKLTHEQIQARRQAAIERAKKHDAETAEGHRRAAKRAAAIINQTSLDRHAYLDSKGFSDELGNVLKKENCDPLLIIPMRCSRLLVGLQVIAIDGSKKFLSGQKTSGAEFLIGDKGQDWFVEGYATALSLKAALGALKARFRIHVTFSASNMKKMAATCPGAIVVADNDESGTGERAAKDSGCRYFLPPTVGQDFNDLHREVGLFRVSQMLRRFVAQQ